MGSFYSRLSYSFGNEDWITEQQALQVKPTDEVLCVTASGDRPLNLMSTPLKRIVTVDANPLQNALFDLKRVSLSQLSHDSYLSFIGATECKNRLKTYSEIQNLLDPMTHALWERQPKKIQNGVLYEGSVEKMLKVTSNLIRLFRGKKIDSLFSFNNLKEQQTFLNDHWHTFLWKKTFQICLHPLVTRTFIKDPGLYEHVDPKLHIGDHLYRCLHGYLNRNLAKESVLLSLILNGKVDKDHLPPYLTKEGVEQIKNQVAKSEFHTNDLVSYLGECENNSFDCFSVSDVASYLDKSHFNKLVEGIYRAARPGARFCIRQFLSDHQIPEHLAPHFHREPALEEKLNKQDRCFVYRFMVGTVQ